MTIENRRLFVALLTGIVIGFIVSNITPSLSSDIKSVANRMGTPVGVIVSDQGKVIVSKLDGTEMPDCNDKSTKSTCKAKFAQNEEGKFIIVNAKTGEPLEELFPVMTVLYGAYKGSNCPLIGGAGRLIDVCSF